MAEFRKGTRRAICEIWKDGKPFKVCSYLTEHDGNMDRIWSCGRPDGYRCRPLYNRIDPDEANRKIKELNYAI